MGISFTELSLSNRARETESFPQCKDWTPSDWACALAGEVGEMCNWIKKMKRDDKIDPNEIAKELADIVIYADLIASHMDIDLEESIINKFNEVSTRIGSKIFV